MAATITLNCPSCDTPLTLPAAAAGKRVKCKHCGQPVAVPGQAAAPAKPATAKPVAKPAPPPPPPPLAAADDPNAPLKFKDDDDDHNPNPYGVIKESDVPRCPHCATELDPPDTKVCMNCGYDLVIRKRHKSKKVYATTGEDIFNYQLPAYLAIVGIIAAIAFHVIVILNSEDWMNEHLTDTFFDRGVNDATKKHQFVVGPGFCDVSMLLITGPTLWFGIKTIINRLIRNPKPPEIEKTTDEEDEDGDYEDDDYDDEDEDEEDDEDEDDRPRKKRR